MFYICFLLAIHAVNGDYTLWSPDGVKNPWCPKMTRCVAVSVSEIDAQRCCACTSKPLWELPGSNISQHALSIEILDPMAFYTKVFNTTAFLLDSSVFSFIYTDRILRVYPENLCEYNIVTIDVTNNRFTEIGNLSCFENLDTLIMKGNFISYVSNDTFRNMAYLRKVDLSHNRISKMDLNVVSLSGVLHFNFESNQFNQIDVTNIFSPNKTFCEVTYAQNKQFAEITNELDFQLGDDAIVFNDVDFSGFLAKPLAILSVTANTNSRDILRYAPCGVYKYNDSSIDCGCDLAVFHPMSYEEIATQFVYNTNVKLYCTSPLEFEGINARYVYENQTLRDQMTCDVQDYCHSRPDCKCKCTLQASQNRLLVDCSNQMCTKLPDVLPESKYPNWLKVNKNQIRNVLFQNYSSRIDVLDLEDNSVEHLNENIDSMKAASTIILKNHSLKTLPKSIQYFHPDVFRFGKKGIPCNCENKWIGEWRKFKKASREYPLYCSDTDQVLIEDMVDRLSGCTKSDSFTWWPFSLSFPFLTLVTLLFYLNFKYDLLLLKRRCSKTNKKDRNKWDNDVYVSFDDNNEEIRYYVLRILDPFFRQMSITTYIPCPDELGGANFEGMVVDNLQKSKYLLIIQSSGMYENIVRQMEYKLGWYYFRKTTLDKILILNFDNSCENFQNRVTRALNRWGMVFMICDRKKSLKEQLLKTFDVPLINISKHFKQRTKCLKKELG